MFKKILIITISILLFVCTTYFGIKYYVEYKIGYTHTYVASHQISQRSKISQDDLIMVKLPKDYLKDDVYIDKDDILGKYVKLSYSIPKGSLIYKTSVESDIKDLANTLLKENEVNYDLYTNDIKINTANLSKNTNIDLYLTITVNQKPISDLLISNARITGLYDTNNKLILDYDNQSRVSIVSIAINSDYVNVLNKALVMGEINCVISKTAYNDNLYSSLNTDSELFEYLQ